LSSTAVANAGTLEVAARPSAVKAGTPAELSQVSLVNTGNIVVSRGQTLLLDGVPVINAGTVSADRGLIRVTGPYTQRRTGTLAITIARGSAGNGLGQLVVEAMATLAGTLRLSLGRVRRVECSPTRGSYSRCDCRRRCRHGK